MDSIAVTSESNRINVTYAIRSIEQHLAETESGDGAQIFEDLLVSMPEMPLQDMIESASDLLQGWINKMAACNKYPTTIRGYVSIIRGYMYYRGIRLTTDDIRHLNLPAKIREEKYPLTRDVIQRILKVASYKRRGLYLAILSSGMRIGEAVSLKRSDISTEMDRITIHIRAENTKTRAGRTVYISAEAAQYLLPRLSKMSDDDLVFGTNEIRQHSVITEDATFRSYLNKIGFEERYASGRYKITLHSLRAFFFTRAARAHDENYAHMMTGHGGYLMQYDRLTGEEKLAMYMEMEPSILVYDTGRKNDEIQRMTNTNRELAINKDRIRNLEERLRSMEALISTSSQNFRVA